MCHEACKDLFLAFEQTADDEAAESQNTDGHQDHEYGKENLEKDNGHVVVTPFCCCGTHILVRYLKKSVLAVNLTPAA